MARYYDMQKSLKTPQKFGLLCAILNVLNYNLYLLSANNKIGIIYAVDLHYIR
jgi:hypothetical protein